ncbi:MAG: carboxypeptidase-like regulatory domain-containing protein [Phycisphaerae bacterium]
MKKAIICAIFFFLGFPAYAIDYNDFPPELRQMLDKNISRIEPNQICIAGRVTFSDGVSINSGKDLKINLLRGIDMPLWVYEDGMFMMDKPYKYDSDAPWKISINAFGYEPVNSTIAIPKGKIFYIEYILAKPPPEKLSTITGTIVNENNEPLQDVHISLSFPNSSHGTGEEPGRETITGSDGRYLFDYLSSGEHKIFISVIGYASNIEFFKLPPGRTITKDFKLSKNLRIVIDYVYQDNNSTDFKDANLQTFTIEWPNGCEMDFSEGQTINMANVTKPDIYLRQEFDSLKFEVHYANGKNGFFDLGPLDFDSVENAPKSNYSLITVPCEIGHVYAVRTYEGKYAKFIVEDILQE